MKVIFNITENKNKATFQQEVVKINTSFNQTENIVKPKFQIGYYPLPIGLENYYTKTEVDALFNQTYNYIYSSFVDYNNTIQTQFLDYYTKVEINSQFINYYTKTELDTNLATKLDKGTYTGTASDLFLNDQNLLQSLQNEQSARYSADQSLENSKQKKVTVIPVTGDITLSEVHNGAYLRITNTCNITIPTGLDANFQCFCYAKGSVIATFVNGGVTLNAPDGLLLKSEKKCSLLANASNNLDLLGELATS